MEYILKTEALTKQYNKRNTIVNVDIAIRLGDVYGLVGRSGAGKTTILKILGGLAKSSSGKICFFDNTKEDSGQSVLSVGALIEEPGIYPDMSASKNLKLKCLALGIKSKEQLFEKFGKNETDVQDAFEAYYFDLTGGREDV